MDEKKPDPNQDLILKLDSEHRQEINSVRANMENFLRGQLALEHKMELVADNQRHLKERFEEGVSKRLTNLDVKFDHFIQEWGAKKIEDIDRDKIIMKIENNAGKAHDRIDDIVKYFAVFAFSALASLVVVAILWFGKYLHH